MYTVMIVEDEVLIRVGLRSMVRWSELNMSIVGEAQNGKQGLELYYEKRPDIILTDIKMPVMDGLEMIEQIRKADENVKIVVLTSYEDFELVRKSFKLGISDYILKVKMLPEDLEDIMKKVLLELQKEGVRKEKPDEEERRCPGAEERCRDYIVRKACSCAEFRELQKILHIAEKGMAVGLMQVTPYEEKKNRLIQDLIREILDETGAGVILPENQGQGLLLLCFPLEKTKEGREQLLKRLILRIQSMIRSYTGQKAVFGVSGFSDSSEELNRLYREGLRAQETAVLLETELIFGESGDAGRLYEKILSGFEDQIKKMDWLTDSCRTKILKELSLQRMIREPEAGSLRESFIRWIHRSSFDSIAQKENALEIAMEAAGRLRLAASLPEMIRIFGEYSEVMGRAREYGMVNSAAVRTVMYIREHYQEQNLSLSRTAEEMGMNKDYLSSLLKKETGAGFSDHVNRLRIQRARELLETTNMRSYEVAQAVGYQDESYFSRVFKRYVGVRPVEYKKHELREDYFRAEEKESEK